MDILAFRRTASGQPWQELNIVVEPNQVLASNGAGQLLAVPKSDFVLSTQIGAASGVAPLGADGKVPGAFLSTSSDVEELNFALAHAGVQVVTVTKKVTIIHVEVGTSIGHAATIHIQGGSGG